MVFFFWPVWCHGAVSHSPEDETEWDRIMENQSLQNMEKGLGLMGVGQYSDAVTQYAKAVMERPQDAWPHIMLGTALYWTGNVDQAMVEYNEALKLEPKNAQACQLMGIAQAWKGDGKAAFDSFSKAVEYAPDRGDIHMDLGSIYESRGDYEQAMEHFRLAVKLEPGNPLYHFQLGSLYSRLGRDAEAAESLENALSNYSSYEDALLELGSVKERNGQNKEALDLFRRAVKIKPSDSVGRFRLARLLASTGKTRDALEVINEAFRLTPRKEGNELSLSLSYSGKRGRSQEESAEKTPQSTNQTGPMDSLGKNLERIPLEHEAKVQVEVIYLPRPQLKIQKPEERSSLKKALGQAAKNTPDVMAMSREFRLQPGDRDSRAAQIKKITEELTKMVKDVPKNSDMRMSMNIQSHPAGAGSGGEASGPMGGGQPGKVEYQPRAVGNDMGLWVMGTAWTDLVSEVMPALQENLEKKSVDGFQWLLAGLGWTILGEPEEAVVSFEKAGKNGYPEYGRMGSAAASIVLGDEDTAVVMLKKVLAADPKNKVAGENLKWLTTTPASK